MPEVHARLVPLRPGAAPTLRAALARAAAPPDAWRAALTAAGLEAQVLFVDGAARRLVDLRVAAPDPAAGQGDVAASRGQAADAPGAGVPPPQHDAVADALRDAAAGPAEPLEPVFELLSHEAPALRTLRATWAPLAAGAVADARAWGRDATARRDDYLAALRHRGSYASAVFLAAGDGPEPALVIVSHAEDDRRAALGFLTSDDPIDRGFRGILARAGEAPMATLDAVAAASTRLE